VALPVLEEAVTEAIKTLAEGGPTTDELARAEAQLASEGRDAGILEPFRRLVEEYHVSLFAQELRTAVPVSAERLARAWSVRTSRPSPGGQ